MFVLLMIVSQLWDSALCDVTKGPGTRHPEPCVSLQRRPQSLQDVSTLHFPLWSSCNSNEDNVVKN